MVSAFANMPGRAREARNTGLYEEPPALVLSTGKKLALHQTTKLTYDVEEACNS